MIQRSNAHTRWSWWWTACFALGLFACSPPELSVPDAEDASNAHDTDSAPDLDSSTDPPDISTEPDGSDQSSIPDSSNPDDGGCPNGDCPEVDADSEPSTDVTDPVIDPCDEAPCPPDATCSVVDDDAHCECPEGYELQGDSCVAQGPSSCAQINCDGHCADCEVIDGIAQCVCPSGMEYDGQDCNLSNDPCDPNPCDDATEVCVPEAHCQPLGSCAQRCDCSNCPNCGSQNIDGRWDNLQQYCGENDDGPATMECNIPCEAAGSGCLPYQEQFCWPMQGCFSQ